MAKNSGDAQTGLNGKTGYLDPEDWDGFRRAAHQVLDAALDKMQNVREGRVWNPLPEDMKQDLQTELPETGEGFAEVAQRITDLMPYTAGNTHPRWLGWVHGAGSPGNILAEIGAAAMNANLGGRDHGPIYVEQQVIQWCKHAMGFPEGASGAIVSGTSIATIVALKTAREAHIGAEARVKGVCGARLVGYCSVQTHSCAGRAFDMLGLGSDALRKIPCDDQFRMDVQALRAQIAQDRAAGFQPFVVIGTAGTVNMGSIDPLGDLADLCAAEGLWFHVDGAFGAAAMLADAVRDRVAPLARADSLAFDFHKWLHVNFDAGCVLIRDHDLHLAAFSHNPDYLAKAERGLSAGPAWPKDYGPELSRGFRALKVWAHLHEHGTRALGEAVARNCAQAQYLGDKVQADPDLELMAPVALNIVCFRHLAPVDDLNAFNHEIVVRLQESGVAVPSTTRIHGDLAIRVNLTNHRTSRADLDLLIAEIHTLAGQIA